MRPTSLLVLAAVLPSCRCNDDEPHLVDAAPTVVVLPEVVVQPLDVHWEDATDNPLKVARLLGRWGDSKRWAELSYARSWEHEHPDAGEWPYPTTHYLIVHAAEHVECGFYASEMSTAFCLYEGFLDRKVIPLKLDFWHGSYESRMRITIGKDKPVVVVRHEAP